MALRKAGLWRTVLPRALIKSEKPRGSFTQAGRNPRRTNAYERSPSTSRTMGMGCVSATL